MSAGDTIKAFFRDPFVQQFGLLTILLAVVFSASQYLPGVGFIQNAAGTATAVVLLIAFTVIPISYIMNYLIYHNPRMRASSGIVGWFMGGIIWVYIIFSSISAVLDDKKKKVPYFGMFPLLNAATDTPEEGGWWQTIKTVFLEPVTKLFEVHIGGDVDKMEVLLAPYIAPAGATPVNESLFANAQQIAEFAKLDADKTLTANPDVRDKAVSDLAAIREAMRSAIGGKGGNFDELKVQRQNLLGQIAS